MLLLKQHAWLRNELTDIEKTGIISPLTSTLALSIIIISKRKDLFTQELTCKIVVEFRKICEQFEYWCHSLMRIDKQFAKLHGTKLFSTLDGSSGYYRITVADHN